MKISSRSDVNPFIVMDVMEAARREEEAGHSVIHMEVGQPGTAAPKAALAATTQALGSDPLGYTVALGLPELRARIAGLYQDWYGVDLSPERVVITSGSSAGFILSFIALFDKGDRIGIGDPAYPSYRNILKGLDLEPVGLQTKAENRFQPSLADIDAAGSLDGLMVASPANPTGTMLDLPSLLNLIDGCHERDIAFISDEIYHGIQYEGRAVTALEVSDEVYVINSFSKYFSMTGWRIGWMVVPERHIRSIERLAQNFFICAPHVSQVAALAAMDATAELEDNLAVYTANRALLMAELPKIGFNKIAPPDGAFYVYADISDLGVDSSVFCDDVLKQAKVAITPGKDFDPERGHATIRFSYARATEDIREGLRRLGAYMASRS